MFSVDVEATSRSSTSVGGEHTGVISSTASTLVNNAAAMLSVVEPTSRSSTSVGGEHTGVISSTASTLVNNAAAMLSVAEPTSLSGDDLGLAGTAGALASVLSKGT